MDKDSDPPPFTRFHPRCLEVEKKLTRAALKMNALGIPRLLGERPAWHRVTPAPAYVIPFRHRSNATSS